MILDGLLFFLSGILLEMALVHLLDFAQTRRHPVIARAKSPRLASTLWGLGYLLAAGLILLLRHFRFEPGPGPVLLFLGFGVWAIFLAVTAGRSDRRENQ